jgi:hypothetical protein
MDTQKRRKVFHSILFRQKFSTPFDDLVTYETENYMTSLNCLSRNLRKGKLHEEMKTCSQYFHINNILLHGHKIDAFTIFRNIFRPFHQHNRVIN